MAEKRKCMLCATEYKYCGHCRGDNPEETWRYLYDDLECVGLGEILYAYRGKEITKDVAKKQFEEHPQKLALICKNNSKTAEEIKAIVDFKEEKSEGKFEEKVEKDIEVKAPEAKAPEHLSKSNFQKKEFKNNKK